MLKLLDYGKPAPFGGIIGRPRHLAWPVNVYRVTLPRVLDDGDGLNAFERVILKLLETVGLMNADALADETRIPVDLVKSVLLRLQDKDFDMKFIQGQMPSLQEVERLFQQQEQTQAQDERREVKLRRHPSGNPPRGGFSFADMQDFRP